MSHGLEISIDGFNTAFATRNAPAWHGLGTVFEDDIDSDELMRLSHTGGWNVRLEDVPLPEGYRVHKNSFFVVRDNPFDGKPDVLGVVGERYNVLQNEQLVEFANAVTDHEGRWETMGSIRNGTQVFASLVMPDKIVLDPNGVADEIDEYMLLTTSHNGSLAIQALNTTVRTVCRNTLSMALASAKQSFKIRHTASLDGRVAAARDALGVSHKYMEAFEKEARELIATEVTKAQFFDIVTGLYPKPKADSKAAMTRWTQKVDQIEAIYMGLADGPDTTDGIRGTAWGVMNALTEEMDWYRKPRKGNAESTLIAAAGLDPVANAKRNEIRKAVLTLV
jgi:phage/plasmid-like protein (TIGR03299 family)